MIYRSLNRYLVIIMMMSPLTMMGQTGSLTDEGLNYKLLLAAEADSAREVRALLDEGADVNAKTWNGITPLMYAAQNGNLEMVKLLIDRGADVNALPDNHFSALLTAVVAGHIYVADTLILNGADVNTSNAAGVTALMYAAAYGDLQMADMLIYYEADVSETDDQGYNALMFSAIYDHPATAGLLLDAGARINESNDEGYTPLFCAVQLKNLPMADFLIGKGADVNQAANNGLTPLAIGIIRGDEGIMNLLLENGANTGGTVRGQTYLDLAGKYGTKGMADIMRQRDVERGTFPHFDRIIIMAGQQFNTDDYFAGLGIGMKESWHHFSFTTAFLIRPWTRKLKVAGGNDTYYQYWENRSLITFGIAKDWIVKRIAFDQSWGITAAAEGVYSFGGYRGSNQNAEDFFNIMPGAGIFYNNGIFRIEVNYKYFNIKNQWIANHWLNMGVGVNLGTGSRRIRLKEINPAL